MTRYRVICVVSAPFHHPTQHDHIISIGTGDTFRRVDRHWMVTEVHQALDSGDTFYVFDEGTKTWGAVEKLTCELCGMQTLCSAAGAQPGSRLEELPQCA